MSNYDNFSSTFAASRKNMRWPEIEYFIGLLKDKIETRGNKRDKLKILDVGCGSGRLYGEFMSENIDYEYLGIDASSGMIYEAKLAFPEANFEVLDMQNLDKLDTKFDAVFFLASFHHLETEAARTSVLQMLRDILTPDGTAYMTNWNLLSDENMRRYESMYRGNGDFDIKIGTHTRYYHGFTTEELTGLIEHS
jgi:SAM-dependent methyltransferase